MLKLVSLCASTFLYLIPFFIKPLIFCEVSLSRDFRCIATKKVLIVYHSLTSEALEVFFFFFFHEIDPLLSLKIKLAQMA